ncbi:MAG: hypothetical protein AB1894_14120 [Chloroflexota bacterium]
MNSAQSSETEEYFEKYGHWVKGEILAAYRSIPQAEDLYGDPITESFWVDDLQREVQYFENVRFESSTDTLGRTQVILSTAGKDLYQAGKNPAAVQENSPTCRTFPETGFRVCKAFLVFFDAHGGVERFGLPISSLEMENERMVQYFEKVRLEWHPETPSQLVQLGAVGWELFYKSKEDLSLLKPDPGDGRVEEITSLTVRAYPRWAVTGSNQSQTLFVIVRDQRLLERSGAQVDVTIYMPSGEVIRQILEDSNAHGLTRLDFDVRNQPPGVVKVVVRVKFRNLEGETTTSFRVWW